MAKKPSQAAGRKPVAKRAANKPKVSGAGKKTANLALSFNALAPETGGSIIGPGSVHYDVGHPPAKLRDAVCEACQVQKITPDATSIGSVRTGDPDIIQTLTDMTMTFAAFKADVLWMYVGWGESNVKTWGDFVAWVKNCYSHYHA
jgi:hypothetical protein